MTIQKIVPHPGVGSRKRRNSGDFAGPVQKILLVETCNPLIKISFFIKKIPD
jgi:hypothetical protein